MLLPAAVLALLELRDRLGVLVEHGDLVPLGEHRFARSREPTRPQPTISTNIRRTLHREALRLRTSVRGSSSARRPPLSPRGGGEDHPAGRLLDHVARRSRPRTGRAAPTRPPSSAPPRVRVGSSAASTIASTPRRFASDDDRRAHRPRAHHRGRDHHALVLLADLLRARAAPRLAARDLLVRHARVERQRHRHLDHEQRLDHGAALALVALLGREPARGADDVVVELVAEHRHEDAAVLDLGARPASAAAGIVKRLRSGLSWPRR